LALPGGESTQPRPNSFALSRAPSPSKVGRPIFVFDRESFFLNSRGGWRIKGQRVARHDGDKNAIDSFELSGVEA